MKHAYGLVWLAVALALAGCGASTDKTCTGRGVSGKLPAVARGALAGHILFVSTRDTAEGEIYNMRADGTQVVRLTNNHLAETYPSVAPDGREVLFALEFGGVYTLSLATCMQQAQGCGEEALHRVDASGRHPEFSPDGQRIILLGNGDVLIMQRDGSNPTHTFVRPASPAQVRDPSYSPDGRAFAFVAMQLVWNLYAHQLDAQGQACCGMQWLGRDVVQPAWSPDSRTVATTATGDGSLCLVPSDGSDRPRRLTAFAAYEPSWSPDGRYLVFRTAESHLAVIAADGKALLTLTDGAARDSMPSWYR